MENGKPTTALPGHAGAAALLGGDGDVPGPALLMANGPQQEHCAQADLHV